ncbi:MAG: Tma20 N-terminal domain-containing protein [Candidatus Lokiarchaeota archaeon]|nr:Tma20 N-terminal domain-containing protein [Candidatus Lokiarchaeota archaeon]
MKIKQRHFIRKSELTTLKEEILNHYDQSFIDQIFPKKSNVELIQTESGDTLFAVNNELKLWKSKEGYIPVLTLLLNNRVDLKTVVVDFGAVRFVTNGADVMRPGITKIDPSIKKGDIIKIEEETKHRALAVGKAMYDASEMESISSGKVIKNLHTIQDSIWQFEKQFK